MPRSVRPSPSLAHPPHSEPQCGTWIEFPIASTEAPPTSRTGTRDHVADLTDDPARYSVAIAAVAGTHSTALVDPLSDAPFAGVTDPLPQVFIWVDPPGGPRLAPILATD
jgi:hypothetical protein